jgi:Fe2+ or Zn2+ uptake regulation protein
MASEQVEEAETVVFAENGDMDRFAQSLKVKGIKATTQRVQILRFLEGRSDHPDVDTIHSELRRENPSLSKTTVYNTLDLLRENGMVQRLTISGTEQRYELATDMHHHLLCRSCGRIYEIEITCPYLDGMLEGEHKIQEVHGYFMGICKHCLPAADVE